MSAIYYAITDGRYLRLFRGKDDSLIDNYAFSLDEDAANHLLEGLADIHLGKVLGLPFKIVEDRSIRIMELSSGLSKMLLSLFNELSGKDQIVVARHGNMTWLNIGDHKGILRLELHEDTAKNSISFYPEVLKKTLGPDELAKLMKKLSEVPGFRWIEKRIDLKKPFTWKYIKDIIIEEPQLKQTYEGLSEWIVELASFLR